MKLSQIYESLFSHNESIEEVIPVIKYDDVVQAFQLKTEDHYMDIVQIKSKDLIDTNSYEKAEMNAQWEKFYRTSGADVKIVALNFPTNTIQQQKYFQHKIDNCKNPTLKTFLSNKLTELIYTERTLTEREFYLIFFADNKEKLDDIRRTIYGTLHGKDLVETISKRKKALVLYKFNNPNTLIFLNSDEYTEREQENTQKRKQAIQKMIKKDRIAAGDGTLDEVIQEDKLEQIIQKEKYDPFLMNTIQPSGGISFKKSEKYITMGDGYSGCIHVYKYRERPDLHWLGQLLNLSNSIVTIDIHTEDQDEVVRNINKSFKEQKLRYQTATERTELKDANAKVNQLDQIYAEISRMGEIVKEIKTRIFISRPTLAELDEDISRKIKFLESNDYKGTVFLNEAAQEWKSFYQSFTYQQEHTEYKRDGQPVPSKTLAGGNPFHFTSLSDPNGSYFGKTLSSNGSVLFDLFHSDNNRTHYSGLLSGTLGSGKSTTLKKIVEDMAARGNFVRGFDVSGEFRRLVERLGGYIVSLDGSDGILNALEILPTAETAKMSYTAHISKLKTIYSFLVPDCSIYETTAFEEALSGLYTEWGFIKNGEVISDIDKLPSTAYPIWENFVDYLTRRINHQPKVKTDVEKQLLIRDMQYLNNIRQVLQNLILNYGNVLNGHTSISNIAMAQVVFFDISNLKNLKSEIFDLQIYNALYYCWGNAVQIGQKMLYDYNDKKIAWEDIVRTLIVIDEAHKIVNTNKLMAVEQILTIVREARKYFTGLLFASQNITDFFPRKNDSKGVELLNTLFSLTQYKFMMKQDPSSLQTIKEVLGSSINDSELEDIPKLERGECILNISGDRNIKFKVEITEEEQRLFTGGV